MIRLSVNVNKVATLRNARGGSVPSVERAAATCLDAGNSPPLQHTRKAANGGFYFGKLGHLASLRGTE